MKNEPLINIYEEDDLELLELDKNIFNKLKSSNIKTVGDLWVLNRKKLKSVGLKDQEINQVIIKLQLLGLDLNKRIYI